MLFFVLDVFLALKILVTPVIKIVPGIKNSMISTLILMISKAANVNEIECPIVKSVTNQNTFFHSEKPKITAKTIKNKIAKLEEVLAGARLIDESQLDTSKVLVLSKVKIKNQTNGMEMVYTLVADGEADLASGKISVNSPIGKGLLGKTVGEVAEIQVPNGIIKFEIISISR